MDIRLALMCGNDIPVPECQLIIHQPALNEIALIGEEDFFIGIQTLCINKTMITSDESVLENMSNFQIFMKIIEQPETADKKFAVTQLFSLVCPSLKMTITPRSLILIGQDQPITIDENNFEFLQEAIRQMFCMKSGPMDQVNFNPGDEKARQIAEKIMKGRAKIAEEKGGLYGSVFSQYLSILTIGCHISLADLVKLTMYQLYDLMERFGLFEAWDLDIKARLAGGKPDTQPDNWMKNIHENQK